MKPNSNPPTPIHHIWNRDDTGRGLALGSGGGIIAGVARRAGILDEFPVRLQTREADLLDIATAVFGTDRLAPRPPSDGRTGDQAHFLNWKREIHLDVPVRDREFWEVREHRRAVERVLAEMTDDDWHLSFHGSIEPTRIPTQMRLFQPAHGVPVALFSGGLDSLAGVLMHYEAHKQFPWLVSVSSRSNTTDLQGELVQMLAKTTTVMPEHLSFSVNNVGKEPHDLGKRQRARSFLYFVFATLVARHVEATEVQVLENGVTSLNVPLSPFLTSTRVTRTTHPLVLMAFETLIHKVLEWPEFRFVGPHLFKTKAEMVAPVRSYAPLIAQTESCARVRTHAWCGTCTACLLRRQVFWESGLESIDRSERARYAADIFDRFDGDEVPAKKRWYFLATVDHVSKILSDPGSLLCEPSVIRMIAAQSAREGRSPEALASDLVDLHLRYAAEWVRVLDKARSEYPKLDPLYRQVSGCARSSS